jgi:hypothetical protein
VTGQRIALVVAVDQYQNAGLRQLISPAADAQALARVLGDSALGGFDVEILYNAAASAICERVEDVLSGRNPSDLVLLHFSCHGLKDESGELYLAATNTMPTRLASTAVDATLVSRLMQRSRARRVVLLLDCCYGGAFERGVIARAGGDADVGSQFSMGVLGGGRGRAVITASSAMEFAFEGSTLAEGSVASPSVFTSALVEGLTTGEADRDNDGHVSLSELYDYVYERVREQSPNQTPCKWEFDLRGGFYVARNPHRRVVPGKLPLDMEELLVHPNVEVRLTAVRMLEGLAQESDLSRAAAARLALSGLINDDSRRVSVAVDRALQATALSLGVEALHFGQVAVGDSVALETQLDGPPLTLASNVIVDDGRVNAHIDGRTVRVSWEPQETCTLNAEAVISGPAGEVRLSVKGQAIDASSMMDDRDMESDGRDPSSPAEGEGEAFHEHQKPAHIADLVCLGIGAFSLTISAYHDYLAWTYGWTYLSTALVCMIAVTLYAVRKHTCLALGLAVGTAMRLTCYVGSDFTWLALSEMLTSPGFWTRLSALTFLTIGILIGLWRNAEARVVGVRGDLRAGVSMLLIVAIASGQYLLLKFHGEWSLLMYYGLAHLLLLSISLIRFEAGLRQVALTAVGWFGLSFLIEAIDAAVPSLRPDLVISEVAVWLAVPAASAICLLFQFSSAGDRGYHEPRPGV